SPTRVYAVHLTERHPMNPDEPYPVQYSVDYPDRPLNRLSTFFRLFLVIPIAIVLALIEGGGYAYGGGRAAGAIGAAGLVVAPTLLLIVFRQKYPRWWFDWNLELMRFSARVGVYLALMEDRYPSTDEHQAVHLEFPYPDARNELNRWLPLVKWLLAIPHYVVLFFLYIAAFFVVIAAWFAILFTGRFPRGMFDLLVGVGRYTNRVIAYAHVLITKSGPDPGSRNAHPSHAPTALSATALDEEHPMPKQPNTRRTPLSRARVLAAAVALADEAGLEAFSMRGLAQELAVVPMALYKHVANKDALLDGMVDIVFGEIELPSGDLDWRSAMRRRAT